jgi:tetratricopeptide (TPR) repeat protein
MSRGLVQGSRYSPGNMTPEALEHLFVGRDKLMGDVLKKIATSSTSSAKHFLLLVGPRGVGKTHFVELLHLRLTTAPAWEKARARLRIAFLNEEEWGVASFLDLLVRILRSLATTDSSLTPRIEDIYSLHQRDFARAQEAAEALLAEYMGKKTLLLICENLEDIFDGISEEGQRRWRSYIQEHPFWTILATAPSLFSAVQLQSSSFYGFFTIRRLEPLDFEGAVSLLRRKAEHEGDDRLAAALDTPMGRARARAIHHLAGGSHRIYVIMSDFLMHDSLDQLAPPFMRMVDDLTPYYQDRVRLLAPQQRKLVEFLAHERRPQVVKDIARRCLMTPQTAAKQLGELAKIGFVQRIPIGRETYCELAEPLMRICFEVKDRRTEHIELFVEFLRRWFTVPQMRSRYEGLKSQPATWRPFERCHLAVALARWEEDKTQPVHSALAVEAVQLLDAADYGQASEILTSLVSERAARADFANLSFALGESRQFGRAIEVAQAGLRAFPGDADLIYRLAKLLKRSGRLEDALAAIDDGLKTNGRDVPLRCLRGSLLVKMGRFEDAIASEDELLMLSPEHTHSYFVKVEALLALRREEDALAVARDCTKKRTQSSICWLALALAYRQQKPAEALRALDRAIKISPDDKYALSQRIGLLVQLHRADEALVDARRLAELDPGNQYAFAEELWVLRRQSRFEEVERRAVALTELHPDWKVPWANLAIALNSSGNYSGALNAVNRAVAIDPGDPFSRHIQCETLANLRQWPETLTAVAESRVACGPSFEPWSFIDAEAVATVGTLGSASAIALLFKLLEETAEPDLEHVIHVGGDILSIELDARGPISACRAFRDFQASLVRHQKEALVADVFTAFAAQCLVHRDAGSEQWPEGLSVLRSTLDDLAECRVALEMLSVGTRYCRERDEAILLDLPLEQRTLLRQRLGLDGTPASSESVDRPTSPPA